MIEETENKKKLGLLPKIGIGIIFIILLLFIYMFFWEPKKLEIIEYPIINENIPESFDGFKIVHFSDIHLGTTINEKELDSIVDKINLLKPDILVFTGDLFDNSVTINDNTKNKIEEILKKTTSKLGKFAIKGDQDYSDNRFEEIMTNAGFQILKNQNIPIYFNGTTPIYIAGIPSISRQEQNLGDALTKEENAYLILLMHEPILFDEVTNTTNLVLAGHSLGGLIRIPKIGGLIELDNIGKYQKGVYQKGSSTLIVSSGLGTQKIQARFLNYPSIHLYRLYHS